MCLPVAQAKTSPAASNVAVEARLVALSAELRCLVCQNESLASSRAPLAEDLRREVREQISAGKTDRQIIQYLTDRYGDFVTYRPPWNARTLLLWLGPLLLMLLGVGILLHNLRKKDRGDIHADVSGSSTPPDAALPTLAQLQREFEDKKDE
ncbi:cytochrome c-type biogenesis protein CcmH [Chitinibacter bivalviorum]|uniref:Cytochrome c-type biogenesis protein n=2 Tax=Chitinibacter bivalviorum TaxID=2739434 RepID=A0A7H9BMG7_9NEIS|nr:cytochrome c-type biogenesis protein CcmH [Chitinibacter bivalviorum]